MSGRQAANHYTSNRNPGNNAMQASISDDEFDFWETKWYDKNWFREYASESSKADEEKFTKLFKRKTVFTARKKVLFVFDAFLL